MRRDRSLQSLVTAAFLAVAGLGLGACEQMADLIPDSKKPLPGERKLLFPEGVPGVTQGVPPEMVRGNQQAQGQPVAPGQAGAPADPQADPQAQQEQRQAEEKPKPKPRPKAQQTVRQQPRQEPQAEPVQPQQQPQQQQQTSPWPAPQQQPAQASPWPSAPAPGTFTR